MGRSGRRGSSSSDAIWQEEKNFLANAENIFLLFFPSLALVAEISPLLCI